MTIRMRGLKMMGICTLAVMRVLCSKRKVLFFSECALCTRREAYVVYSWWYSGGFVSALCTTCSLPNTNEAAAEIGRFTSAHQTIQWWVNNLQTRCLANQFSFTGNVGCSQQVSVVFFLFPVLTDRWSIYILEYISKADYHHYKATVTYSFSLARHVRRDLKISPCFLCRFEYLQEKPML